MKNRKVWFQLLVVVLFFGSIWGLIIVFTEDEDNAWKTWDHEMESSLGNLILENYRLNGHLELVWSEDFVHPDWVVLSKALEIEETDVSGIFLYDSEEINAFTLPGNNILICLPLIEFADTPEEFVGVIAHEIGHIHHRHIMKMIIQKFTINALISVVAGQSSSSVIQLSEMMVSSSFSRDNEREADQFALNFLTRNGIAKHGLARFFEKLNATEFNIPQWMSLLNSHPMHDDRVELVRSFSADTISSKSIQMNWDEFQERMSELME